MRFPNQAFHWKVRGLLTGLLAICLLATSVGCSGVLTPDNSVAVTIQEDMSARTAYAFSTPYQIKGTDGGQVVSPYKPTPLPPLNNSTALPEYKVEDFTSPKEPQNATPLQPPVQEPAKEPVADTANKQGNASAPSPFRFASMNTITTKDPDSSGDDGSNFTLAAWGRRRGSACANGECSVAEYNYTKTETVTKTVGPVKDSERLAKPAAPPQAAAPTEHVHVYAYSNSRSGFLANRPRLLQRLFGAISSRFGCG